MPLSGYQVESVLNAFRRQKGYYQGGDDTESLEISQEARFSSYQHAYNILRPQAPFEWVTPQSVLQRIEDQARLDPITEYEQQRRAGQFLNPVYLPPNPPPPILPVHDFEEDDWTFEAKVPAEETSPEGDSQKVSTEGEAESPVEQEGSTKPAHSDEEETVTLSRLAQMRADAEKRDQEKASSIAELELDLGDDSDVSLQLDGESSKEDDESDVVYGTEDITTESMVRFVHNYTSSAVKYVLGRELDGSPLTSEVRELYRKWSDRGMQRKKVLKYILLLMDWSEVPADYAPHDLYSAVRDRIFDMK